MTTLNRSNREITFDDALEALRACVRRRLLVNLMESNPRRESAQFEELSFEGDAKYFETQLRHVHLPKLAEMGFVEWDRESGRIVKGPAFDEIRPLLEVLTRHEDELPDGYL
ncbi:transcriptional regulator [Natribaculum luteum]|uniref:Transcriptional regulator n=1 Tax=Natribaculum luteum TaxID=1586232 RepID=A0ABD5P2Y6_9EURY|nr:transcriptional regulator [Natribaculum luteum]